MSSYHLSDSSVPQQKYWDLDPEFQAKIDLQGQPYVILDANSIEFQKLSDIYARSPIPNYEIDSVKVIHNPRLTDAFVDKLQKLENRSQFPVFAPKWGTERNAEKRTQIIQALENISFIDQEFPHLKILPVWSNFQFEKSDFSFGDYLDVAYEPEYAYQHYCENEGPLLCGFAALYSAYPFTHLDKKIPRENQYQNYDAHLLLLNREGHLCRVSSEHNYTNLVLFEPAFLPRYFVELKPSTTPTETSPDNRRSLGWTLAPNEGNSII